MSQSVTLLTFLARAYVSDRLMLDPGAGQKVGDQVWIGIAGQLLAALKSEESAIMGRRCHGQTVEAARLNLASETKQSMPRRPVR
jgi:hypothetical protein